MTFISPILEKSGWNIILLAFKDDFSEGGQQKVTFGKEEIDKDQDEKK